MLKTILGYPKLISHHIFLFFGNCTRIRWVLNPPGLTLQASTFLLQGEEVSFEPQLIGNFTASKIGIKFPSVIFKFMHSGERERERELTSKLHALFRVHYEWSIPLNFLQVPCNLIKKFKQTREEMKG